MASWAEYVAAHGRNSEYFRQRYPAAHDAFEVSVTAANRLGEELQHGRGPSGQSFVALAPLYFIFQRQSIAAFAALSANQAYVAWSLIRPGIEAALMLGKWVDDPGSADVWYRRKENRKAYRALFEGKNLQSAALPRSPDIQGALALTNDFFLHPNPDYYFRHLEMKDMPEGKVELSLNFFDNDVDMSVGILGVLHLVIVVQESLAGLFATQVSRPRIDVALASFEEGAHDWALDTMKKGSWPRQALLQMGLWPDLTAV